MRALPLPLLLVAESRKLRAADKGEALSAGARHGHFYCQTINREKEGTEPKDLCLMERCLE